MNKKRRDGESRRWNNEVNEDMLFSGGNFNQVHDYSLPLCDSPHLGAACHFLAVITNSPTPGTPLSSIKLPRPSYTFREFSDIHQTTLFRLDTARPLRRSQSRRTDTL